ncbi:MAG: winged helix-turn-helix transcriptional regulator [Burkholderiaceae bacterium]|jgi:DNA-binding IclR family transcriptional regulator|nr:winged helix-turn-helix transcriptional regulator [Burkholderiaceae bacterium]
MNTAPDTAASEGGLRLLTILEALCGFAASGASNSELATAAKTSAPNVTRAMRTLIAKGWARKGDDGRFYPTTRFLRLALAALADVQRVETRLADLKGALA